MKSENPLMKYPRNDGCDFKSHPQPKFGSSEILSILAVFIVHREGGDEISSPSIPLILGAVQIRNSYSDSKNGFAPLSPKIGENSFGMAVI